MIRVRADVKVSQDAYESRTHVNKKSHLVLMMAYAIRVRVGSSTEVSQEKHTE